MMTRRDSFTEALLHHHHGCVIQLQDSFGQRAIAGQMNSDGNRDDVLFGVAAAKWFVPFCTLGKMLLVSPKGKDNQLTESTDGI